MILLGVMKPKGPKRQTAMRATREAFNPAALAGADPHITTFPSREAARRHHESRLRSLGITLKS
jgi:hypothetical protein